ncbi:MAG: hypothetical protein IPM24_05920 [Bryobacterales bacterium]|nr:hypothetical protein [Bryobacterales bacterium]
MCHPDTVRRAGVAAWMLALLAAGPPARGQFPPPAPLDWRLAGGPAIDLLLTSPVTGPVDRVWYSADGGRLFAQGQGVFETLDGETWIPAPLAAPPPVLAPPGGITKPRGTVRLVTHPANTSVLFALGQDLYRSSDRGQSWTNLTRAGESSILGGAVRDLAVSPVRPDRLVAAGDLGLWQSNDGGLSWTGLNENFPNLPPARILATPRGLSGLRAEIDGIGPAELRFGAGNVWYPAPGMEYAQRVLAIESASLRTGAGIAAIGGDGDVRYAASALGRIWVSVDGGTSWRISEPAAGGPVTDLWVDPDEPRIALASLASGRILRTINTGATWTDVSGDLGSGPVHAIAATRGGGALYAATNQGLLWSRLNLETGAPGPWLPLREGLPPAPATHVRLDPSGYRLFVSLLGHGIYGSPAPHRNGQVRIVNAADFSTRAAAPGSLLSVLGARVEEARSGALPVPVLAAAEGESQLQVPFEAAGTQLALTLGAGDAFFQFGVPLRDVSPAIFTGEDGAPMLLDADTGLLLDASNPARSGARVQVLATGLGRTDPVWPTGLAAPLESPPAVRAAIAASLDRAPVPVTRATLAPGYIGFYLVEVQLPALMNAGPAELAISAGGVESNRVRIWIEP